MRLVLSELRYFVELAHRLSFTNAAEALGITQPTLSTAIRQLEGKLGQKLFDRDTRGVRLTPFGNEALRLSLRLLENAVATERELADLAAGRVGRLRIAAPSTYFATILKEALVQFRRENSAIQIEIEDTDGDSATELLRRDLVDFSVTPFVPGGRELTGFQIGSMQAVAVYHPDFEPELGACVTWADLSKRVAIILRSRDSAGRLFNENIRKMGVTFAGIHRLNEFQAVRGLIESGFGVGVMSDLTASQFGPPFRIAKITPTAKPVDLYIYKSALRTQTPIMGRFLDIIRANFPRK
ncbi:LysR family transcriptional regulator [Pararhodobacter sp.]|uniref:LysR family transcriptional regulator n=1 Tax=Pararhodobacter sp. TaxID=2127056 RepID=UPI002AFEBF7D|nr:LysR family transcriptional regulator [Pararhodobacter sp.]